MSWGTNLRANIEFDRCTFTHKSEVEEALEFESMNANDILWDIIRQNVNLDSLELRELTEQLEQAFVDKYKLKLLLENWDKCHASDGTPVHSDEPWTKNPEIWGDFINGEELRKELQTAAFKNHDKLQDNS